MYIIRSYFGLATYNHAEPHIIKALQYSVLGLCIFLFSHKFAKKYINAKKINLSLTTTLSPTLNWLFLFFIIISSHILLWQFMGAVPLFIENYHQSERAIVGKGLGFLEAFCKSTLLLSLMYFIQFFRKPRENKRYAFLFLTIIVIFYLLNADRGGLLLYLISLCFVYYLCVARIKPKQFIAAAIGLILLASAMGAMRSKNLTNFTIITAIALTEISVEFDNYVETYNMFNDKKYLNGSTLIPILTIPIPRSFFPAKDDYLTAGNFFKEYHNHDNIRVGERMSYIGELYMNGGLLGIILGMLILGNMLAIFEKKVTLKSNLSIYIYIQLIISCKSFIEGDIVTAFLTFFMNNMLLLPLLSLTYFYKHMKNAS